MTIEIESHWLISLGLTYTSSPPKADED